MEVSGQLHALAALPLRKYLGTHLLGGWVGPRAAVDVSQKRKQSLSLPGFEIQSVQFVASSLYPLSYVGCIPNFRNIVIIHKRTYTI